MLGKKMIGDEQEDVALLRVMMKRRQVMKIGDEDRIVQVYVRKENDADVKNQIDVRTIGELD